MNAGTMKILKNTENYFEQSKHWDSMNAGMMKIFKNTENYFEQCSQTSGFYESWYDKNL